VDKYELPSIARYQAELLDYLKASHRDVVEEIRTKKALDAGIEERLKKALTAFGEMFQEKK
jgi:F-type H+-transporting ATPase subunit alpha